MSREKERIRKKLENNPIADELMEHSWGQKVVRFYDPDGNLVEDGTPVN